VSDGLGAENLKALKNLCYDFIPKIQLDTIDVGLDVFNVLIEKTLIGADNVAFLCELLDAIGRKDLTDKVKTYVERMEAPSELSSQYVQTLDRPILKAIADEVGKEWKMLSRHLNVDEVDIDSISREHHGDLKEAALKALLKWKVTAGDKATPKALKKALVDMKLLAIVHKYFAAA
jgi:hypothetical protein